MRRVTWLPGAMPVASLLASLAACATPGGAPVAAGGPLVLRGEVGAADLASYKEIPFEVPAGVNSLTISVEHDGRTRGTVIDLGLRDPAGFRGWSGSNKSSIHIAAEESTPSFRAGPVSPGRWTLILGLPAIRSATNYRANIVFDAPPPGTVTKVNPGWRRGDFHAHTGHSDGSCANATGLRVPCPVHFTLDAAVKAGLDFVSVTDHNTLAQNNSLLELEPFYSGLTIVRGSEITTFKGHANALGIRSPVDFQLGTGRAPDVNRILDQVDAQGGVLSINHPGLPSGPACMGCGWTAETDWSRVAAIEVINGGSLRTKTHEGPVSGVAFWEKLLNQGFWLAAVGGSDNHDATDLTGPVQSPVGRPATVVWAAGSGEADILAGVRSGRVFVDIENGKGRSLDVVASAGDATVHMGGILKLGAGQAAIVKPVVEGAGAADVQLKSGGLIVEQAADGWRVRMVEGATSGWARFDVRDSAGKLLMVGNPVYFRASGG